MGRSKYNYLPRAYVTYPLVCPDNLAAGEDPSTALVYLPVDMETTYLGDPPAPGVTAVNRVASPVLGGMYSAGASDISGTSTAGIEDASATCLNNDRALVDGTGDNETFRMGYDGDSGMTWLATKIGSSTGQRAKLVMTADTGDTIVNPALSMILSPGRIVDAGENEIAPSGGVTNTRGPVAGALCTIHFQETDLADGEDDTVVRALTMPFGMRVQKITFASAASGTANTCWVENSTQSTSLILYSNVINSATPVTEKHEPGDGTFLEAGRDLARGDVIELHADTNGTSHTAGFSRLTCTIIGHVTDHITADGTRIIPYDGTTWPSSHEQISSEHSGPVAGGLATLYLAGNDAATGQTDTVIASQKVPFDCTILHAQFQYYDSDLDGNNAKIMNGATEIIPDTILGLSDPSAHVITSFTNATLEKDDTLTLSVNTGSTAGFTNLGCTLLVHVTGFPHTDPLND